MVPGLIRSLFIMLCFAPAFARDNGQYAQSPLKQWFDSLKNGRGTPCCSDNDGFRVRDVDWTRDENGYRVFLCAGVTTDCAWYDVPPHAVIHIRNLAGDAMVWRQFLDGKPVITCFLPGAET